MKVKTAEEIQQMQLDARDKLMKMCPPYVVDEGDGENPPLPMRTRVYDLVVQLTRLNVKEYSHVWTMIYDAYQRETGIDVRKPKGLAPKKGPSVLAQLDDMGVLPHLYEFIWERYAPQKLKEYHFKKSLKVKEPRKP